MELIQNEELLLKLARRVRELRLSKSLTQVDANSDTGIHFGRIEQGKRDVSISTIKKICDYFEISMSDFVKGIE